MQVNHNIYVMKNFILLFAGVLVAGTLFGQDADHDFNTYGSPNVTASRLIGKWKINLVLTNRLAREKSTDSRVIEFVQDSTVMKLLSPRVQQNLSAVTIFKSGFITSEGKTNPFILTERDGNTHLLWFRDRDGVKYDDTESFILFIAVGHDKKNDLLCIGGDFNNQPFSLWDRVK